MTGTPTTASRESAEKKADNSAVVYKRLFKINLRLQENRANLVYFANTLPLNNNEAMVTVLNITLFSGFNVETIIRAGGLLIICLAVFAQTGLIFCFFVPSGVFLFTGGMFVATGQLEYNIITVCSCSVAASVSGCIAGYWLGQKTGPMLYKKKDSRFFKQKYLKAAGTFYTKYGKFALTLGMLFPITRTFAPIVAGIVKMNFGHFVLFVFIGSALWISMFLAAGYLLGSIPAIKEYLHYIMIIIILVVTIPVVTRIITGFKKAGKDL